jgi:CIC family chloride channel protein
LADQGKIFTNEHDKNLLFSLHTEDFIDKYSQTINENATIADLFELVKNGKKNFFAVVDDAKKLRGILTLDDIRPYLFNQENNASLPVTKIMKAPPALIKPEDKPLEILQIFDDTGFWNLPVVDQNNKFVGFISKSSILMSYRQVLKGYSE